MTAGADASLDPRLPRVGQVFRPRRLPEVVVGREVVAVEAGFVGYRPLGRDCGRTHRTSVADFWMWAAYWEAGCG